MTFVPSKIFIRQMIMQPGETIPMNIRRLKRHNLMPQEM